MKKRILAGILAVSMVGALLTGCGKGASQSADAAPAAGTEEAAEAEAGTEQEAATTERAQANEIVIGIAQDLDQSMSLRDLSNMIPTAIPSPRWHRKWRSPTTVSSIRLPFATA